MWNEWFSLVFDNRDAELVGRLPPEQRHFDAVAGTAAELSHGGLRCGRRDHRCMLTARAGPRIRAGTELWIRADADAAFGKAEKALEVGF